jgi:hemoglobin-like flavoprotein
MNKPRLFETDAALKNDFQKFKDKDNSALQNMTALHNHAMQVMEALDTVVTELEEADKTHQYLLKIGKDHKARGIPIEHLDQIKTPFLKAVDETLGDRFTDRMRTIYETFMDYVIKTIKTGYNS